MIVNRKIDAAMVAAAMLVTGFGFASATAAVPDEKAITAYAQRALQIWQVPGMAIAVVENGKTQFVGGIGVRELGKPERMDADTVFTVASVSKAFAAMAAAIAVDRGQIEWDQPVIRTLPEFRVRDPYATAEASFRDLFAHRVGVAGFYVNGLALSRQEMVGLAQYDKPREPFRSGHVYSNLLYGAAGLAVANAVGSSWDDHVRAVIFEPLGMSSSSTTALALAEAPNRASSHLRGRDGVLRVDPFRPRGWWSMDNHAPAGAVNSTARDMAKWLEFQLGDGSFRGRRLLAEETFTETHLDQAIDRSSRQRPAASGNVPGLTQSPSHYTLGWRSTYYHKERILQHGGLLRGHGCIALIHPDGGFGVFVFANAREGARGLADGVAQWIFDRHLELPERDWAQAQKQSYDESQRLETEKEQKLLRRPSVAQPAPAPVSAFVGTYQARDSWERYVISLQAGKLRLELQQMAEPYFATLDHWTGATFRPAWNETVTEYELADLVNFTFDAQGGVRSMVFFHAWTDVQEEFFYTTSRAISRKRAKVGLVLSPRQTSARSR